MKRIAIAGLAIVLGPATAFAAVLDGRWGLSVEACNEPDAVEVMTIDTAAGTIDYYESVCDISDLAGIGTLGLAWRASLSCSGEGETWSVKSLLGIEEAYDGGLDRLAMIDVTDGFTSIYHRCP